MNERIKELAEQAAYDTSTPQFSHMSFKARFAELIVRECADLSFRSTGFVTSEGEDMVRSMIKQHFGVE